jgi:beta-fructofuranosidase
VLLYSTAGSVAWESGELDPKELKFHSERRGVLDHGAYYAQKTQLDAEGNRILWGWIPEKRPDVELIAAGWAGCMALPRILSLSSDGGLQMNFVTQTHALREKTFTLPIRVPSSNQQRDALRADVLRNIALEDVRAELAWKTSDPAFSLALEDRTGPWWSAALKTGNSAATLTVNGTVFEIPATTGNAHEFHLFLDASVAELIVDQRQALTTRIYRPPNGPLRLKSTDASQLESFQAWQLRPISPDRLTT